MCGVGGALGPRERIGGLLQKLEPALAHRGPDDAGCEIVDLAEPGTELGLVHRRLSIIDLTAAGHQPMRDAATGNWISYNGEIYNYRGLRTRLQGLGHSFTSDSDTEVILKAYGEWGVDCLQRLRGMFAFALWDQRAQRLLLAVDRLGIKPLYYCRTDDGLLLFASEVRALLATECVPRRVDPSGLESYLAFGSVQAPHTIVQGVRCLRPGHYALVDGRGQLARRESYWTPPFVPAAAIGGHAPGQAADLREALAESVRLHLVGDVPVGLFLSGGIDSSSLVALASRDGPVQTFSVVFPEADFSEAPYSRLVAERYRTEHCEISLDQEACLDLLPDALSAMDQPTADGVNVYAISRAIRQAGFKVALSGQGGDELLTGYATYRLALGYMRLLPLVRRIPISLRRLLADAWRSSRRGLVGHKMSDLLQASDDTALSAYLVLRSLFLDGARRELFELGAGSPLEGIPEEVAGELREWGAGLDPVNRISLYELRTYLANTLLRDSDIMGMAHGLEIRVPFLDHELVEAIAGVPGTAKYGTHKPKPLLLDAMGDLLPREVAHRPKAGFTFPWEHWLRGRLRPLVDECLGNEEQGERIGLNAQFCHELWTAFQQRRGGVSWARVWGLFCLYSWCARHRMLV